MAKHPTSSRVHRENDGPDDAFVSTVKRSYGWGRQNARLLATVATIILVVLAAAIWYTSQQRELERQAALRLAEVQQSVSAGNAQLAIRDLQTYLDRFGGTETADQGRLLLATVLLGEERGEEALDALGDLPDDLTRPFGLAAARLEAAALEDMGRVDEAVDMYLRIEDQARFEFQRQEALADAARVRLQHGDADASADLYSRLVDTFEPNTPQRSYYEMWLAEARAQAREGAAAPTEPVDDAADQPEPAGTETGQAEG